MQENTTYQLTVRLFKGEKCFGPGVARLLRLVGELHSLRAAAASMGMAYSKAWRITRECEQALGFPLLISITGGKNGGGATLTPEALDMLRRYDAFLSDLQLAADALMDKHFSKREQG